MPKGTFLPDFHSGTNIVVPQHLPTGVCVCVKDVCERPLMKSLHHGGSMNMKHPIFFANRVGTAIFDLPSTLEVRALLS